MKINNKIYGLFIALFFLFGQANAEINKDTAIYMEKNLSEYEPPKRINVYRNLINYYSKNHSRKALKLSDDMVSYATSQLDSNFIVESFISRGYLFQIMSAKNNTLIDSSAFYYFKALTILDEKENYKNRYSIYLNLGTLFEDIDNRKSYIYFEKALESGNKIGLADKVILYINQKISYITLKLERYEKSISYNLRVLELLDEMNREKDKISYLHQLGLAYFKLGKYEKSLSYYFRELKLRQKFDVNPLNDDFLDKLAKVYLALGKYDKAENYYKRALSLYRNQEKLEPGEESFVTAQYYTKLGRVYYESGRVEKSTETYQKALKIIGNATDKESLKGKTIILNNLALNYKKQGNPDKALETIKESEELMDQIGLGNFEYYTLTSFSEIYSQLDDLESAEKYLLKALENARKEESTTNEKNALYLLYQLYEEFDVFDKALIRYKDYKSLTDSVLNVEMTDRLAEFQTLYEMEKKEQDNLQLKRINQAQREKAELERQTFIVTTLFAFFIVLVMIMLYFFRKRASKMLEIRNDKIEKQNITLTELNEELRLNERQLKHANATKDKFLSIIAHDLKNPMHSISFSSDLIINYYDQLKDDQRIEHVRGIHKTSEHAYNLLENLLQWAKAQNKSMDYMPQDAYVKNVTSHVMQLLSSAAENKKVELIDNVPKEANVFADVNMLETVIRNLLSNSIKYCNEGGKISIDIKYIEDYAVISVKDNGIGINEENMNKLFKIEEQVSTMGTNKEKGTGLGLMLCKEFMDINKGDIWADSKVGEYTVFYISLPKTSKAKKLSEHIIKQNLKD